MNRTMATLASILFVLAATAAASPRDAFLGEWRGTSTCTDRKVAPACKDEVVVYRVTPARGDTAHLAAYKIVEGEEQPMGELDFSRNARTGEWTSEFRTPRVHAVWSFRVADTLMTGTLVDVPTGAIVRRVRVTRPPRR
jgi:hypothetical protein